MASEFYCQRDIILPEIKKIPSSLPHNDGFAVIKHWKARSTISKLRENNLVKFFILVAIDNAIIDESDLDLRTNEYLPYPDPSEPTVPDPEGKKYPEFLFKEVIPLINNNFRTLSDSENTGLGGSSHGAYIALDTEAKYPEQFGMLLLESTPIFIADFKILHDIDSLTILPNRISIGIGDNEISDSAQNI